MSDRFFCDGLVVPLPMHFPEACSEYFRLSISSFSCRLVFGCGYTISGENVRGSSARSSVCSEGSRTD